MLVGIKSKKETVNITPAAKLRDVTKSISFFLIGKNMNMNPNKVDNPANVDKMNAYVDGFMESPIIRV